METSAELSRHDAEDAEEIKQVLLLACLALWRLLSRPSTEPTDVTLLWLVPSAARAGQRPG
jgi:hypothetical protein